MSKRIFSFIFILDLGESWSMCSRLIGMRRYFVVGSVPRAEAAWASAAALSRGPQQLPFIYLAIYVILDLN